MTPIIHLNVQPVTEKEKPMTDTIYTPEMMLESFRQFERCDTGDEVVQWMTDNFRVISFSMRFTALALGEPSDAVFAAGFDAEFETDENMTSVNNVFIAMRDEISRQARENSK